MAEGNIDEQKGQKRHGKRNKKLDKVKKVPKILSYLFLRNGLAEKDIQIQTDGYVNVDDILDVYSDFTFEDIYEATSSGDSMLYRQCPQTGIQQIKIADAGAVKESASHSEPSEMHDSRAGSARHRPQGTAKPSDKRLSKFLSWLLRHGAEKEGFRLQPGGFLYVDEILQMPNIRGHSLEDIRRVVDTNEKQRFYLEPHPENGRPRIRANQGHSMQVDGLELQRITSAEDFPIVLHGTYHRNWQSIKKQGLKRMNRTHIHFAPGEPKESGVISGMRGSCDILIYIDLAKALPDGLEFYLSANNVILSPGDADGVIKPKYFASVFQRSPRIPIKV